jgi:hypothetical protein
MTDNVNDSPAAFQELVRVFGEAIQVGVTSLNLEYEDRELIVYYRAGNVGLGAARFTEGLDQAIIEELIKRAGLGRKSKGKMKLSILGSEYEVFVEQYDNFDEPAFNLTIKAPKKKTRK